MDHEKMVEIFGEVISSYPDSQACEDGILVPVTKVNRVTRPVWEWMVTNLPEGNKPPDRWPVEMMGWFRAESPDDKALAAAKGLIDSYDRQARNVWDNNIGGGVFTLWVEQHDDKEIRGVCDSEFSAGENLKLWIIPNEVGGVTLMFPEDY